MGKHHLITHGSVYNSVLIELPVDEENVPRNKGDHCPFRKSQLDSRTFGVAGQTGLWTHYHSKIFELVTLNLKKRERD